MARFKAFVVLVVDHGTSSVTVHGTFRDYGTADGVAHRFTVQARREDKNLTATVKGVRRPAFQAIFE